MEGLEHCFLDRVLHLPDIAVPLVVARYQHRPVRGTADRLDRHIVLGNQLVRAFVFAQVPYLHRAVLVARYQLSLVRVDDHLVHGAVVFVVSLDRRAADVPHFDCSVLAGGAHPSVVDLEGDGRDVVRVALERLHGAWVRRPDVVEIDLRVPCRRKVLLIGGDFEPVHLRVAVLDCAGAHTRQGLPKADRMVVSCRYEYH